MSIRAGRRDGLRAAMLFMAERIPVLGKKVG